MPEGWRDIVAALTEGHSDHARVQLIRSALVKHGVADPFSPPTALQPASPPRESAAFQNTDDAEPHLVLAAVRHCAASWEGSARLLGNVRASDIVRAIDAVASPPRESEEGKLRRALRLARDAIDAIGGEIVLDGQVGELAQEAFIVANEVLGDAQ